MAIELLMYWYSVEYKKPNDSVMHYDLWVNAIINLRCLVKNIYR